jgi:signal transduction histidine kinase
MTAAGVATRVVLSGSPRRLSAAVDRAVYRIVQEALTNVLRHAGPASATVRLRYETGRIVVDVLDDGSGISASHRETEPGSGHGIAGMRERALSVGGHFDARPCVSGGFRVRAVLPDGGGS